MKQDKSENLIKQTCRELGITQKELAERMGVKENTVSKWARGAVETPKIAVKMFDLLKTEQKYNRIKELLGD